jgi:hypothetical protein
MKRLAILLGLLLIALTATAQELVYFEGDVRVYERVNGQLFELQDSIDGYLSFGYELDTDYVVKTFDGFAEIVLPNGHVLKLDQNTEIQLSSVLGRGARGGSDIVSVASGRLRSVVSNLTGSGRRFEVHTPTAVGGVRGTDFVTLVGEGIETIAVQSGLVEFTNNVGEQVLLAENQFANALGDDFVALQSENIAEQFYGLLNQLSEEAQQFMMDYEASIEPPPGGEQAEQPPEPPSGEEGAGEGEAGEGTTPTVTTTDAVAVEPATEEGPGEEPGAEPSGGGLMDELIAGITNALGFEIGTVTLEGETYSKVIAQPTFRLGKLGVGLYLPIIYTGNLFDPSEWYRPRGNNEWSFGTDQDWAGAPLAAVGDVLSDLALKIRFLSWGSIRDPFFFSVGSLDSMSLGHGLLMRNYANNTDFPTVRRVGLNLGIDFGAVGFQALTNDLARPEIFGARLYARPFGGFPLAIGVSGVTDIGPARDLPEEEGGSPVFVTERETDPLFINMAVDLDFPILEREAASLILYGDVGAMVPYLRNASGGLEAGMQWDVVNTPDGLRNYGIAAGLMGTLTLLDYRLEFQDFHGTFQPAFYDSNYDRLRGEKAREAIAYLLDPNAPEYENQTMGVFGEAGINIADLVAIGAGYFWPWTRDPDTGQMVMGDNDRLIASLWIQEGLLPYGITAGAGYERTHFVPTLLNKGGFESARLLDEYSVLSGRIVYPIAPIMDIVATISTQIQRDEAGNIMYEDRGGELRPVWGPVISIETVLGDVGF